MRSLFEKNLLRMKRELTDLKTVHQRGLGTVRFFTKSETITRTASGMFIKATIEDSEPEWPLFSVYATGKNGIDGVTFCRFENQTAKTITFAVSCTTDFIATVVCSSAIKKLEAI